MQSDDQIDKYESRFKSAFKQPYSYSEVQVSKVALICRNDEAHGRKIQSICSKLLPKYMEQYEWSFICEDSFSSVRQVLNELEKIRADLIISERNIKVTEESLVYGLSPYVETVTQVTETPVILLPSLELSALDQRIQNCDRIMAETSRLTGDDKIVNWGVSFVRPNGRLHLYHIEDSRTFDRYIGVLERIPEINTEIAALRIKEELLKLPADYIESAKQVLAKISPNIQVEGYVTLGSSIRDYKKHIEEHEIDLLIVNSKDHDHLAMEGMAYEIAVEFKEHPLLLL